MTEIKVIEDVSSIVNIDKITESDREIIFERLIQSNPNITKNHFENFSNSQNEIILFNNSLMRPKLKELLIRQILKLNNPNSCQFTIRPLIKIPQYKSIISNESKINLRKINKKVEDKINVRFNENIKTIIYDPDKKNHLYTYIVPKNQEVNIIGIEIIEPTETGDNIISDKDQLLMGLYTYSSLSKNCNKYLINPTYKIKNITLKEKFHRLLFDEINGSDKLINMLNDIFDSLSQFKTYHINATFPYIISQIQSALTYQGINKNLNDLFNFNDNTFNADGKLFDNLKSVIDFIPKKEKIENDALNKKFKDDKMIIKFLEKIEKLSNHKFSAIPNTGIEIDLNNIGFLMLYYMAVIKGIDSKEVKNFIENFEIKQSKIKLQQRLIVKQTDEYNKVNSYLNIIEKMLGAKQLKIVEKQIKIKPQINSNNILKLLKPAESKIIKLEYIRRENYIESVLNNKCPHVKINRQLRGSVSDIATTKYFNSLKKFINTSSGKKTMYKCSNCKFDIICPHFKDLTESTIANKSFKYIKSLMTQYIDKTINQDNYYCKICGEVISNIKDFADGVNFENRTMSVSNELKTMIWGEFMNIMKYIKVNQLVNIPKLVSEMQVVVYPLIFSIEKRLIKSKTSTVESINNKKKLFISIYGYAYIIHIIISQIKNNNKIKPTIMFKDLFIRGTNTEIKQPKPVDLIKHVIKLLINTKNVLIRSLSNISIDFIKNKIIEAYKLLSSDGPAIMYSSGEPENMFVKLLSDPVYKYIYSINTIYDSINSDLVAKQSRSIYHISNSMPQIMGFSLEESNNLKPNTDIFNKIKIPNLEKWNNKSFDTISEIKFGNNHNVYDDASVGYKTRSFQLFLDGLKSQLYLNYVYSNFKLSPVYVEFLDKFLKVHKKELLYLEYKLMYHIKNFHSYKVKSSIDFKPTDVTIGRIYDENGIRHNWSIIIIKKNNDKARELTISDIKQEIIKSVNTHPPFENYRVINKKCNICNILFSETNKLSVKQIEKSLKSKNKIINFFRFYNNRCPKIGIHEFNTNSQVCKKCDLNVADITDKKKIFSKKLLDYYKKYESQYNIEKKDIENIKNIDIKDIKYVKPSIDKYKKEYKNWAFNYNSLLELSNKLSINVNLLSILGGIDGKIYKNYKSGIHTLEKLELKNSTRLLNINNYIKIFITEYNTLRHYHTLIKIPSELKKIITSAGIHGIDIEKHIKKLPDVYDDFSNRLLYFKTYKNPNDIVNFAIEKLSEISLIIYNKGGKIGKPFIKYIINKIIKNDELRTKPDKIDWKLFNSKDCQSNSVDSENNNSNYATFEYNDQGQMDLEDADNDFGNTDLPFSRDALDVEGDSDNDIDVAGYGLD